MLVGLSSATEKIVECVLLETISQYKENKKVIGNSQHIYQR